MSVLVPTARMAQALKKGYPPALLAQIEHPLGTRYFWTGVGEIEWSGNTFTGVAHLGTVSQVKYSADIAIQEISFQLSGVPVDDDLWLTSSLENRNAYCWLACIHPKYGYVVPDPIRISKAILDYPKFQASEDGSVTIQLIAHSGFYTLERALDEVHSPEDQKATYPDDTGLDLIAKIQQQDVIWQPSP